MQDVLTCALSITSEALAPIFLTSAVTGLGLDLLRLFVDLAPLRRRWGDVQGEPLEFMIDETFGVPGVGTVVAGTIKRGTLNLQVRSFHGPCSHRTPLDILRTRRRVPIAMVECVGVPWSPQIMDRVAFLQLSLAGYGSLPVIAARVARLGFSILSRYQPGRVPSLLEQPVSCEPV